MRFRSSSPKDQKILQSDKLYMGPLQLWKSGSAVVWNSQLSYFTCSMYLLEGLWLSRDQRVSPRWAKKIDSVRGNLCLFKNRGLWNRLSVPERHQVEATILFKLWGRALVREWVGDRPPFPFGIVSISPVKPFVYASDASTLASGWSETPKSSLLNCCCWRS